VKKDKPYYLIYRIYGEKEKPGEVKNTVLFGWTRIKSVAKAFLGQRNPKKYILYKVDEENLHSDFSEDPPVDTMIDYIKLKSASTGEENLFFTTVQEAQEAEKKIQRVFSEMCSLENTSRSKNGKDIMYYLTIFTNIIPYYADALYDIGFRPPELNILFDSADFEDDDIYERIDLAYSEGRNPVEKYYRISEELPGQSVMEDVSKIILYSLESFIRVLRDDL
jgi:hypothetical protein